MSSEKNNVEMLKEHLASWKIGEVVKLALSDDRILIELFGLLHEKDDNIKIRALMAIEEVLNALPDVKRAFLIDKFLENLINAMKSNNDSVAVHALRATAVLIDGVPLLPDDFITLANTLKDLVNARRSEVVFLEIQPIYKKMKSATYTPELMNIISRLLTSRNLRLKAMGLRLLFNAGTYTKKSSFMRLFFSEVPEMLGKRDILLSDFVLDLLIEASQFHLNGEIMDDVARALTAVKNVALGKIPELREKARRATEAIERAIHRYYQNHPEKAKEKIQELLINERFYEAIDLAFAVGDTYSLNWLEKTLETMEKKSLEINQRILPGPKYPSVPPEKKSQRHLKPPTLSQFKSRRKSSIEIVLNEPRPGGGLNEEEKEELKRALETGEEGKLIELSERRPEVVFELTHKLEGGDKFDKMDALWALSRLAERLDTTRAFILRTAMEPLMNVISSKNRWMRLRAAKTLAILASKAPYGDEVVGRFLEDYLSGKEEKVVSALEFFSYYFDRGWDEKTARVVLSRLQEYLEKEATRFDALLTLETLVRSAPVEKAHLFRPFVEKLKKIKKTASPDEQKLAIRILESISEKAKELVHTNS
ncbi:hypothetical protein [Palaeococcus ferrophilus]|uniref:hypothetical protein n=1 Tax=Palaeococcus ferrophilus TaxID=83868 RepID=UPI00064F3CCC|nr:hypothetical protein [Palaeococcus ferrophilus]